MAKNLYSDDNVAYRQYIGNTLAGIKNEIANLDGVEVSTEATFAYTTTKAAVTVVANFDLE